MKNQALLINNAKLFSIALLAWLAFSVSAKDNIDIHKPAPPQLAWQQAELGVVFHYDLHVFDDKHYNQPFNRKTPCADINAFNPTQLDTDQWVRDSFICHSSSGKRTRCAGSKTTAE